MNKKPQFTIVAGANGAGKSSNIENTQESYLNPDTMGFLNVKKLLEEKLKNRKTVAIETNLIGDSYLKYIKQVKANGFEVNLIFVTTDNSNSNTNVKRVANRVKEGGHDIPIDKIHSRYKLGHKQLAEHLANSDNVKIYDNTKKPKLVLEKKDKKLQYMALKMIGQIMGCES